MIVLLLLLSHAAVVWGSTMSFFVFLQGNRENSSCPMSCTTPSPSNFSCSWTPYFKQGAATFIDPLPENATIRVVWVGFDGRYHCRTDEPVLSMKAALFLNGAPLIPVVHTGSYDCDCDQCSYGLVSGPNVFEEGLGSTVYNYGGVNEILMELSGDEICFGGYEVSFEYDTPTNAAVHQCCVYMDDREALDVTCTLQQYGCVQQESRELVQYFMTNSCEACWGLEEPNSDVKAASARRRAHAQVDVT